jgi:hypothetical protein
MKLADIVKEARGWEGEGAGFKAGIESGDASVRWMGSFSGRSSVIVRGLGLPALIKYPTHLYITFGPPQFIFSPSSPFPLPSPLHVSFLPSPSHVP